MLAVNQELDKFYQRETLLRKSQANSIFKTIFKISWIEPEVEIKLKQKIQYKTTMLQLTLLIRKFICITRINKKIRITTQKLQISSRMQNNPTSNRSNPPIQWKGQATLRAPHLLPFHAGQRQQLQHLLTRVRNPTPRHNQTKMSPS